MEGGPRGVDSTPAVCDFLKRLWSKRLQRDLPAEVSRTLFLCSRLVNSS